MSRELLEKQIADIDSVILTLTETSDKVTDQLLLKQYYLRKELESMDVPDCCGFCEQNKELFDSLKQIAPIDLECKSYEQLCLIRKAVDHKEKLSEAQFKILLENL